MSTLTSCPSFVSCANDFFADHPHDAWDVRPGMTAETDDVGNYNALGGA
jgi:hypothetical protein